MEIDTSNGLSESSDNDSDTCDVDEINNIFDSCPHVHSQLVSSNYILHIAASSDTYPFVATALSNNSCEVYSLKEGQVAKAAQLVGHSNKIIDCKFSSDTNKLFTGSNDGTIKLWDLRDSNEPAITFADTTATEANIVKPISSFDVSPCSRLLAAGTDLTEGEAFILFWDIRNTKLLGAYWESHTDDITQVSFNPDESNRLMSGSTDGLINIYDLSQTCEDDALQDCLNTEALVENLQWFYEKGQWKISCITSTNDLQLWETNGAEPYKHFRREEMAKNIKKKTDYTYLVKSHPVKESLLVLAGSNGSGGKILRSTQILNGKILPAFQFTENSQRVRASWINQNTNLLITGGEKGILDIWKPNFNELNFKTSKRK